MTTILGLLGALQGLVLAGAVASLGGPSRLPNRALAALLLTFSTVVAAISAQHAGLFGPSIRLILIEQTAAFIFPPLLWRYANIVLGAESRVRIWLHFLPAALWLAYLALIGLGLLGPAFYWLPPILGTVVYLVSYTAAVALRVWRAAKPIREMASHHLLLRVIIAFLAVLHLAQLIRYVFQDVAALTDIVPLTATWIVVVLSILVLRQSRFFTGHEHPGHIFLIHSSCNCPNQLEECSHAASHYPCSRDSA